MQDICDCALKPHCAMSEQVLCVHSLHLNLHFLHLRILLRVSGSWTQSQHAVGERD